MQLEAETLIMLFQEEAGTTCVKEYEQMLLRLAEKLQKMVDENKRQWEEIKNIPNGPFTPIRVGPPPKTLKEWAQHYKETGESPWNRPLEDWQKEILGYFEDSRKSAKEIRMSQQHDPNFFLTKEMIANNYKLLKKEQDKLDAIKGIDFI